MVEKKVGDKITLRVDVPTKGKSISSIVPGKIVKVSDDGYEVETDVGRYAFRNGAKTGLKL